MSLAKLKTAVTNALEDLATLEVASFTGTPTIDTSKLNTQKSADVFKSIKASLTTSTLVGYSRFEVEGDAMNYTNSDLGEGKKYLLDAHASMVEGAQKSRKDFFEFVMNVIKS